MDSSNLEPLKSLKRYLKIEAKADYQQAIDQLLDQVINDLRIFDQDLAEMGFNSAARHEKLRQFLLKDPNNRLFIVVHNTDYLNKHCPRMLSLLKQFSKGVFIQQTMEEIRHVQGCFIIADKMHFLNRPHHAQLRAFLGLNHYEETQALYLRFNEIWESSAPAISATTLGL